MVGHAAPGGAYKYFVRAKTLAWTRSWRKGEFTSPAQVKSMGSPPGTAGWGVPPAQGVDQGHGAKVLLGGGIDKAKVFRHIDRSVMRDGGQGCYPCDLMGPSRALRPRQFSPDGDLLFARAKRRQKHAGGQARMNFKRKGRAFVQSACTPGPPLLRGPRIRTATAYFRRWGKPTLPASLFSLPLHWQLWKLAGPSGHACSQQVPGSGALPWAVLEYFLCQHQRQRRRGARQSQLPQRRSIEGRTEAW